MVKEVEGRNVAMIVDLSYIENDSGMCCLVTG